MPTAADAPNPTPAERPGPPLRVLHVDAAREWRGGQNQIRLLVRELAGRDGVEQALLAGRGSRLAREVGELGAPVFETYWRAGVDPRAVAAVARRAGTRDVVHAHGSHALQAAVLGLALSGADAGLVASRRTPGAPGSAAVWRRADLVLAVSSAVGRGLASSGLDGRRVRVVHDGVDPPDGTGADADAAGGALRAAADAPAGCTLVGSVGALEAAKGPDLFLRAAARLAADRPDVRFVAAGEGPMRAELEAGVRERGLEGRFALPGHVEDAARSLGDLDLFVMPSRGEGLGTAALEAMAAGVPTVVARAGGLADVAGDAVPWVPPGDPGALAEALGRLLDDPEARRAAAEAGRRRVEERFTAARMAGGTLAAWRAVAAARRRRREHGRRLERLGRLRRARPPRPAGPAPEGREGRA